MLSKESLASYSWGVKKVPPKNVFCRNDKLKLSGDRGANFRNLDKIKNAKYLATVTPTAARVYLKRQTITKIIYSKQIFQNV